MPARRSSSEACAAESGRSLIGTGGTFPARANAIISLASSRVPVIVPSTVKTRSGNIAIGVERAGRKGQRAVRADEIDGAVHAATGRLEQRLTRRRISRIVGGCRTGLERRLALGGIDIGNDRLVRKQRFSVDSIARQSGSPLYVFV